MPRDSEGFRRVPAALVAAALAVALGSAGVMGRDRRAQERWQEALVRVGALAQRIDARPVERPALWGETREGRAQLHYDRALALVAGWDEPAVRAAVRAEDDEARKLRAAFLVAGAQALSGLHHGAHARGIARPVEGARSRGSEVPIRKLSHARTLVGLCEMKAAALLEHGRDLEAVGVLLDAMQFAGDLAQGPLLMEELIGLALLVPPTLLEGAEDGTLARLSPQARQRLTQGVTALDRRLGWQVQGLEEELVLRASRLDTALDKGIHAWRRLLGEGGGGCRRLTCARLLAAEYVEFVSSACDRLDRTRGPGALQSEVGRLRERGAALTSSLVETFLPKLEAAYTTRFRVLARLRLLALAFSGDEPDDPWLAAHLRVEERPEGSRWWLDHPVVRGVEVRLDD